MQRGRAERIKKEKRLTATGKKNVDDVTAPEKTSPRDHTQKKVTKKKVIKGDLPGQGNNFSREIPWGEKRVHNRINWENLEREPDSVYKKEVKGGGYADPGSPLGDRRDPGGSKTEKR